MWQIEHYYKKLWLESSTQGENCVMESRQWSSWWRVHVSHVKAFELYNSPAQMASLRTQTQHLFLRPVTSVRLLPVPGIVLLQFLLLSHVLHPPNQTLRLWVGTHLSIGICTSQTSSIFYLRSVLVGFLPSTPGTVSFMTVESLTPFPAPFDSINISWQTIHNALLKAH